MKIFALETDKNKIMDRFCHQGECVVLFTYYHAMSFFLAIIRQVIIGIALLAAMGASLYYHGPLGWSIGFTAVLFTIFVGLPIMKSWIDWCYDFILITTDKIIIVDQTSIFKQEVKPIHIENIGSVSTSTQWWGIFNFGTIILNLKEGEGGDIITKHYVPNARQVASKMSDVVTRYQRGNFAPATPAHRQRLNPKTGQQNQTKPLTGSNPQQEQAAQQAFEKASDPRRTKEAQVKQELEILKEEVE